MKIYLIDKIILSFLLVFIFHFTHVNAQKTNSKSNKKKVVISFDESSDLNNFEIDAKEIINTSRNNIGISIGENFPEYSFIDINGDKIDFKKIKDKLLVLNFWFVGCRGCKKEEPFLKQLTEEYKSNKNVIFISFCTTKHDLINKYILKHGDFGYKIISIPKRKEIKKKFKVKTVPTHYIIKNGIVVENINAPIFNKNIMKEYKKIIDTFVLK